MLDSKQVTAIAQQKVEELKAKKTSLENDLEDMRRQHQAAGQQYGSELSADDMIRKENALQERANEVCDDITLMVNIILRGLDEETVIKSGLVQVHVINKIDEAINTLVQIRETEVGVLEDIERTRELLQIQ